MPWKECHVTDERLRFVARLLEGEKMAALCASIKACLQRLGIFVALVSLTRVLEWTKANEGISTGMKSTTTSNRQSPT